MNVFSVVSDPIASDTSDIQSSVSRLDLTSDDGKSVGKPSVMDAPPVLMSGGAGTRWVYNLSSLLQVV